MLNTWLKLYHLFDILSRHSRRIKTLSNLIILFPKTKSHGQKREKEEKKAPRRRKEGKKKKRR